MYCSLGNKLSLALTLFRCSVSPWIHLINFAWKRICTRKKHQLHIIFIGFERFNFTFSLSNSIATYCGWWLETHLAICLILIIFLIVRAQLLSAGHPILSDSTCFAFERLCANFYGNNCIIQAKTIEIILC